MLLSEIPERERVVLILSRLSGQKGVAFEKIKDINEWSQDLLVKEIGRLVARTKRRLVAPEIHPDWIAESLKKETPRMIAAILRHLSGEHANAILEILPDSILKAMPQLSESFALDPGLAVFLKKKFEENFDTGLTGKDEIESILLLRQVRFVALVKMVGFLELAMAFAGLPKNVVELILNRLPPKDAEEMRRKLPDGKTKNQGRLKQAQANLLALDLEEKPSGAIITDTGLFVFSKAVSNTDQSMLRALRYKMSLKMTSVFDQYFERNGPHNTGDSIQKYRNEILACAKNMGV